MDIKYSKEQFEGYTHRFMVLVQVEHAWRKDSTITIYSNDDSNERLEDYLNEKKSDKVVGFEIIHKTSKEQDDIKKVTNLFL